MKPFCSSALGGGFQRHIALLCAFLALALLLGASPVVAQRAENGDQPVFPEYQVKAALLLNFTRYVSWPEEAFANGDSPIVVGILGEDPSDAMIAKTFPGKMSHGRAIEVRRLDSAKEATGCCQLIFVSRKERHRLPHLLAAVADEPVLLVGESERFLRDGGGINLMISEQERPEFEINLDAMEAAGLRMRTDFVRFAKRVLHDNRWEH